MNKWGYDETNGVVIGGNSVAWKIAYDGKEQQTFKSYSDNYEQAMIDAQNLINEKDKEYCLFKEKYSKSKWTVNIYN